MSLRKRIPGLAALFSALGLAASPGLAQDPATSFATVEDARRYLREDPTGPLAVSAFRFIVNSDISATYPEFPRSAVEQGYGRVVPGGGGVPRAEVEQVLDGVAGVSSAAIAPAPVPVQTPAPLPPGAPAPPVGFGY